ncbi:MAG TPA: 8-amino-7-oxononanoate synthase [Firmicutes bacterium]|jgi:glycine C-acetyltransferase|nr:8-amino-7-oxononanoate synthase [Bacillota bacterium]
MATVQQKLAMMKQAGTYRVLPISATPCEALITLNGKEVINLSSNNYLGFANHPRLKKAAKKAIDKYGVGAGAVRTIVGNMDIHEELDKVIAKFKGEEAALVFQSGFACNSGVIQAITDEKDLIISDELNHASIIDGVRLSKASRAVYRHSDMADLERILKEKRHLFEEVLIITDGVFSMDGDLANLPEIVRLAKLYKAQTYVDDAHGSGVLGDHGRGTVAHFHLHGQVDYIIGTLSKAIGVVGGYVCCSKDAREYLLHVGRPLLFSTAMMPGAAAAIIEAFKMLEESEEYTNKLWDNAHYFKKRLREAGFDIGHSQTPITPIIVGDEAKTLIFSKELLKRGVFVSGIVFPTVPKGRGRIRCMVNAMHTKDMIDKAVAILKETALELKII